jgi:phenylpyruvate tautomerase PptA (4-oxalocrotonate tautomerase family)
LPLYRCLVPSRSVRMESRQAIARAITAAHCDATGAPAKFVHVFFFDMPESDSLTVLVNGSIRAGRTDEQKQRIVAGVQAAFVQLAGVPAARTRVDLTDVPASWLMEGGRIMPEPGDEAAWLAAGHE